MVARAAELLSDAERARFARVIRPQARDRVLVARAALRVVLGGYLGVAAEEVRIERGPGGKPFLAGLPPVAFNLAHSGELAVVAMTSRPAVGVDVERVGRRVREGVVRRALSAGELESLAKVPPRWRNEAFLRHWVCKEAYGKAIGAGLAVGMARVVISGLTEGDEPQLADPALVTWGGGEWSLQSFDPGPGWVGAVVCAGGPWRARAKGEVRIR